MVLWSFKDSVNFCSVNLAVFSANLKKDGVTWKVIEKLRFFGIIIILVGYNLHPLNSQAYLNFMEQPRRQIGPLTCFYSHLNVFLFFSETFIFNAIFNLLLYMNVIHVISYAIFDLSIDLANPYFAKCLVTSLCVQC